MSSIPYEVHHLQVLTLRTASLLASITSAAVEARGMAHIALSGENTLKPLFKLLATPEWQARVPWAHTHIWWVDERCVRPDDPESHYGMARARLLRHLPVVITHRIRGEEKPWQAAYLYEKELVSGFNLWAGAWPRFDLILLEMAADGHAASLQEKSSALSEKKHRVTVIESPRHPRVSLTLPVFNHAANIIFLATGADKGPAVAQIFDNQKTLPAAQIRPIQGNLLWLLDTAAQENAGVPLLYPCNT